MSKSCKLLIVFAGCLILPEADCPLASVLDLYLQGIVYSSEVNIKAAIISTAFQNSGWCQRGLGHCPEAPTRKTGWEGSSALTLELTIKDFGTLIFRWLLFSFQPDFIGMLSKLNPKSL